MRNRKPSGVERWVERVVEVIKDKTKRSEEGGGQDDERNQVFLKLARKMPKIARLIQHII